VGKLVARLDELEKKQNLQAESIASIMTKLDQLTEQISNLSLQLQGEVSVPEYKPAPVPEPPVPWLDTVRHYAAVGKRAGQVIENIAGMVAALIDSISSTQFSSQSKSSTRNQSAVGSGEIDFSGMIQSVTRLLQGLAGLEGGRKESKEAPPAEPSGSAGA